MQAPDAGGEGITEVSFDFDPTISILQQPTGEEGHDEPLFSKVEYRTSRNRFCNALGECWHGSSRTPHMMAALRELHLLTQVTASIGPSIPAILYYLRTLARGIMMVLRRLL